MEKKQTTHKANDLAKMMKMKEAEMNMRPYTTLDELLLILAKWCVKMNYYEKEEEDEPHHTLTKVEMWVINRNSRINGGFEVEDGYLFLDDKGGKEGMIRLYPKGNGNTKWSFWMEDGVLKVYCD
jgi:hypothetical protein